MRYCPYCKTEVQGSLDCCPLCQNELSGEASADQWPATRQRKLQKLSLFYKIQLFIALSTAVILLWSDLILGNHGDGRWRLFRLSGVRHWSLVVFLWILSGERFFKTILRHRFVFSKHITRLFFYLSIMMALTGWYCGFLRVALGIVIPIFCSVVLGLNLIFCAADRTGSTMAYMLTNILVGIVPCGVFLLYDGNIPVAWSVCLLESIITLLALVIFKGRAVAQELSKRFNM